MTIFKVECLNIFIPGSTCREDGFACGNGKCVHISKYCDFAHNCNNGVDEQDCGKNLDISLLAF